MRVSTAFVTLLVVGLIDSIEAVPAAETAPSVIFFLSDDQRADFMGCAGHEILKTPTMDRLAAAGTRFANAFVTTSICAASRASLLTGMHERTHGYTFGTPPLSPSVTAVSYPALLRTRGYRTGLVGKLGVNLKGEGARMFDVLKTLHRNPYFKKQSDGSRRHLSEVTGDRAIEFLESCPETQPFCLAVCFNAPHAEDSDKTDHYPWPQAVDGLYDDVEIPSPNLADPKVFDSQPEFLKESLNRQRWYWRWDTAEKYQKNVRAYYRMISGVDHVMGRVLSALQRLGRADDTIVVFTGDNGYYRGDRGFAGKWSHYEESLRVPLIVYDPRLPAAQRGRVEHAMCLNLDVPATILAAAGVPVPAGYRGRSLLPFLRGETPSDWRQDFFCEHLMNHGAIPKWEGVRSQRYVYARYFQEDPAFEFLHDLQLDPDQLHNYAGASSHSAVLEKLRRRCDTLRDRHGGTR